MKNAFTGKIALFLTAWLLLCCTGCANLKDMRDISIRAFRVESLSVESLRKLDAGLTLTVDNPAKGIEITAMEGTVYRKGSRLGTFTADSLTVPGKAVSELHVALRMELDPAVSPLSLMSMASDADAGDFTADITLKARLGKGPGKKFTLRDIPLKGIISNLK